MEESNRKSDGKSGPKQENPVHSMMIFEEVVRKEVAFLRSQQQRADYTVNPLTMPLIAEKPNHVTPARPFHTAKDAQPASGGTAVEDEKQRAERLEQIQRQIKSASMQPREKYPFSQTAS
jgi:hypothetical protein